MQPSPPPAGVHLAVLTDRLVERVLSESCFVSQVAPRGTPHPSSDEPAEALNDIDDAALMSLLSDRYRSSSSAADWHLSIPAARGVGSCATLIVPGWIRERAAEILFGDGPDEAQSLSELVLDTLLKVGGSAPNV
jgi:actin-related protein 10